MTSPEPPKTHWQLLATAADKGNLYLNPEAALACSRACDVYIGRLNELKFRAEELAGVSGWGDFDSGKQLQEIFSNKAVGGENNMVDVLQSHIDVVEKMKIVFGKFFAATHDVDNATAGSLQSQWPN